MMINRSKKKRMVEEDGDKNDSKKTRSGDDHELSVLKEELKLSNERNNALEKSVVLMAITLLQLKKIKTNSVLVRHVLKQLDQLQLMGQHNGVKRLVDIHHGEGNFLSKDTIDMFDEVLKFDFLKNKHENARKYPGVGSWEDLNKLLSSGNLCDVVLADPPYVKKQANYNGLNSGEKSLAYAEYNSRYGLDLPYTNQQLLLFQTESMYIASRLLRDGGYLLLKSKQGDIGLSNLVCEASIGTNLERMGEINFLTECSSSSDMLTCAVDGSAVTQLIVFRKVGKPTRSLGSFYHQSYPTLSAKVGTLKKQARLDYIDQGLSKRRSNNLMKTCVAKLWDYCCECQNKKKSGDDRLNPNHIFGTLGKQLYHMSSRRLTWNSDKFDWKNTVEHSTLSLGRLQVHVMNESMNSCIVANMATILFSRVLKIHEVNRDLSIENEMKNNYKERRDCLAAAGIVGEDAHQLFLNSTVARMIVNAKHLRLRYE